MMNLQKHFVYVPTKELFNTLNVATSIDDEEADIKWNQIAFINDTQQIWTHGEFFGAVDNVEPYELMDHVNYMGETFTEKSEMFNVWYNNAYNGQGVKFKPYLRISKNTAYTIAGVPVVPQYLDNYGTDWNMRVLMFVYPDSEKNSIHNYTYAKNKRYEINGNIKDEQPRCILIYRQSKNNPDKYTYYRRYDNANTPAPQRLRQYLNYNVENLIKHKNAIERSRIRKEVNKMKPDYATCQRGWINISDTALICSHSRLPRFAPRFDDGKSAVCAKSLGDFDARPYYIQEVSIPSLTASTHRECKGNDISIAFDTDLDEFGFNYSDNWYDADGNVRGSLSDNNMGLIRVRMYKEVLDEIRSLFEKYSTIDGAYIWLWAPNRLGEMDLTDLSDADDRMVLFEGEDIGPASKKGVSTAKICAGWINANNELCGGNWMKIPVNMFYTLDDLRDKHGYRAYVDECGLISAMGITPEDDGNDQLFQYCDVYYHPEMMNDDIKHQSVRIYIPRLLANSVDTGTMDGTETYGYIGQGHTGYNDMQHVGYVINNRGFLRRCNPFLYPNENKRPHIFYGGKGASTAMLVNDIITYVGNTDCKVRRWNQTINPLISRVTATEGVFNAKFDNKITLLKNDELGQSMVGISESDFDTLMKLSDLIADDNYEVWAKLKTHGPGKGHRWRRFMTNRKNNVRVGLNIGCDIVENHQGHSSQHKYNYWNNNYGEAYFMQQYDLGLSSHAYKRIWHDGQWNTIENKQALAYYMLLSIIHGAKTFMLEMPEGNYDSEPWLADECKTKTGDTPKTIHESILAQLNGTYDEDLDYRYYIRDPRFLRNWHLCNIDLINGDGYRYIDFMVFPRIKRPANRSKYIRHKRVWAHEGMMFRLDIKYTMELIDAIDKYSENALHINYEDEQYNVTPLEYLYHTTDIRTLRLRYLGTCKHPKYISKHLE